MITKKQQQQKNNQKTEPQLIICPYCKENIPIIKFIISDGYMCLRIRCICFKEFFEKTIELNDFLLSLYEPYDSKSTCLPHNQPGIKYCLDCSIWLCQKCLLTTHQPNRNSHEVVQYQLNRHCSKHAKPYTSFCYHCNLNLCEECNAEDKKNYFNFHRIDTLDQFAIPKIGNKVLETFDHIIHSNKSKTDLLLKEINEEKKQSQDNLKTLQQMTQDLLQSLEYNMRINSQLTRLYKCLNYTAISLRSHPIYQVGQLVETIHINNKAIVDDQKQKSLNDKYTALRTHLRTNYVLYHKITNQCISYSRVDSIEGKIIELTGSRFAVICYKTIEIMSSMTFQLITAITCYDRINSLIQLQDNRLASVSGEKTISLWNSKTFECCEVLNKSSVNCLIQLANGNLASGGNESSSIVIWDLKTFQAITQLSLDKTHIYTLIEIDERRIAFSCVDIILIWDYVFPKRTIDTLEGHSSAVCCLLLLKDGVLASSSFDYTILLWDLSMNIIIGELGHSDPVYNVIQLPNGYLASGCRDTTIKIWDYKKEDCMATLETGASVYSILYLNNGKLLSTSSNSILSIWNISSCYLSIPYSNN